ncbi:retrovirus-related pol polyprotein from transposon TNT 1-94 [Tanacetum coccineum]
MKTKVIATKHDCRQRGMLRKEGIDFRRIICSVVLAWIGCQDLCAYAAHKSFPIYQMDVENGILNGPLKEEMVNVDNRRIRCPDHPDKRPSTCLRGLLKKTWSWKKDKALVTIHHGTLVYEGFMALKQTAFSDADHAGCLDTRKSTSGGIQFLENPSLSPNKLGRSLGCHIPAQNQQTLRMSSTGSSVEAGYVALSASCAQVMWMRTHLKDYDFNYNKIPLYYDSQSAIAISCNPVHYSRTKHIHTRFQYLVRRIGMRCLTPAELEVLSKESA